MPRPMRIDAHQHFWMYNPHDYGWISDSMAVLRRDFLPPDLEPELARVMSVVERYVSGNPPEMQEAVLGGTARRVWRLDSRSK